MAVMTVAQALVRFLDNQYVSFDGKENKFVEGIFTVFGHGIVCGRGQALDENPGGIRVFQGKMSMPRRTRRSRRFISKIAPPSLCGLFRMECASV